MARIITSIMYKIRTYCFSIIYTTGRTFLFYIDKPEIEVRESNKINIKLYTSITINNCFNKIIICFYDLTFITTYKQLTKKSNKNKKSYTFFTS